MIYILCTQLWLALRPRFSTKCRDRVYIVHYAHIFTCFCAMCRAVVKPFGALSLHPRREFFPPCSRVPRSLRAYTPSCTFFLFFPVLSLPVLSLPPVLPGSVPVPLASIRYHTPRAVSLSSPVTPSRTRSNKKELDITPANKRTPYLYMNLYSWYRKTMAIPLYSLRCWNFREKLKTP